LTRALSPGSRAISACQEFIKSLHSILGGERTALRVGINAQKALERETGVGNYAYHLTLALAKLPEASDSFRLFLLHGKTELTRALPELDIESVERPSQGSLPRILWEQLVLPRQAARAGMDLLHCVDHAAPLFNYRCPVVITVHDLAFYRLPAMYNTRRRFYKQFIGLRSIHLADHIIAVSESTKRDILELAHVDEAKITIINYGLSPIFHQYTVAYKEQSKIQFDLLRPFFLFVGTLQPRKNLENLLAAFGKAVIQHHLPHELLLAGGDGWLTGDLVAAAGRFGIADRVRFLGKVPHEDLPGLYANATALVYPSWYEGFGLPPLEAMACGTPVITGNSTSLPEVIDNAGILIDPSDVSGLAKAMTQMATNTDLHRRLAELGPKQANKFCWDECARRTYQVYEQVYQARLKHVV
jgi:glycosyltransferase involved in cell wall biosynthesis